MGEIAWVRKYRPTSFTDYMGDDVKNLVINRFKDRKNIPNTIMLYGTRGTGKTSMARLLCKEIQCLNPVDGHSCGECEMCQAIDEYISATEAGADCPGITEVDAATTTGKSDINDIIDDALIPPMYPIKHKVIIMDECHMLSVSAQNSLLKVVEEPPEHLIFILCTTDPDKVISTIRSRIQLSLEVKKKTIEEMVNKLEQIAEAEGLKISRAALQIIAKKGDRIPRECIMLLESVAKNSGGDVTIQTVREQLGEVATAVYIDFYDTVKKYVSNGNIYSILKFTKDLQSKNIQPKDFVQGLARFTLDCLYVKHAISLEDYPTDFVKQAKKLFDDYNSSAYDYLLLTILYAYSNIGTDDVKNELVIINTALKIGKCSQLAKVGTMEKLVQNVTRMCIFQMEGGKNPGQDENIQSIKEYQKLLEQKNKSAIDRIPETEIKKEAFASMFNGMEDVKGGNDVIASGQSEVVIEPSNKDSSNLMKRLRDMMDS